MKLNICYQKKLGKLIIKLKKDENLWRSYGRSYIQLQDCAAKTCRRLAIFAKVNELWINMNCKDIKSLSGIYIKFSNPREQKD